jgi:hypothetical protein
MNKLDGKGTSDLQPGYSCVTLTLTLTLQPGCLADRLLAGLGQPQLNPSALT